MYSLVFAPALASSKVLLSSLAQREAPGLAPADFVVASACAKGSAMCPAVKKCSCTSNLRYMLLCRLFLWSTTTVVCFTADAQVSPAIQSDRPSLRPVGVLDNATAQGGRATAQNDMPTAEADPATAEGDPAEVEVDLKTAQGAGNAAGLNDAISAGVIAATAASTAAASDRGATAQGDATTALLDARKSQLAAEGTVTRAQVDDPDSLASAQAATIMDTAQGGRLTSW